MAVIAISALTALGAAPATGDLLCLVDISDTSQAPTGTTKKMTVANLFTAPTFTTSVTVVGPVQVTGGSSTAGAMWKSATQGLVIQAVAGSTNDFFLGNPGATAIMTVPTGTLNVVFGGTLGVTGLLTASAGITVTGNNITRVASAALVVDATTGNSAVIFEQATVITAGLLSDAANTIKFTNAASATMGTLAAGALTVTAGITHGSATLLTTTTALTNGAAAQVATMTNGPTAGNPSKWIPINDNGTTRYIPAW